MRADGTDSKLRDRRRRSYIGHRKEARCTGSFQFPLRAVRHGRCGDRWPKRFGRTHNIAD